MIKRFRLAALATPLDVAALLAAAALLVLRFRELHHAIAPHSLPESFGAVGPGYDPAPGHGWWSWLDQSLYLRAAQAWARGDLDPAAHWYPPGYALLGALFVRLTPLDPFMVPDLLCWLACLLLFALLAGRLLAPLPCGRAVGAVLFTASSVYPKLGAIAWVVPWTTTPTAACLLLCLVGTVGFVTDRRPIQAATAAFAVGCALAMRPADAGVVGGACGLAILVAMARSWTGWRPAARILAAAAGAGALPILVFGAAYLLSSGLRADGYLVGSRVYGFEWRLLPLRWVLLMVSPRPLYGGGEGLAQAFPFIAPGLMGMLACMLARGRRTAWLAHAAVGGSVLLDTVQFLCYRDLHPDYLWANGSYHYFKWTLPLYALYALRWLGALLAGPRLLAAGAAAAVAFGLLAWRVAITDRTDLPAPSAETASIPQGLGDLRDAVFLRTWPGEIAYRPIGITLEASGQVFHSLVDFKPTPWSQTLLIQPVRALPSAPSTLTLNAAYRLDPAIRPVLARQTLLWGLPCWVRPARLACQSAFVLPSPALTPGRVLAFGADGEASAYIAGGMSLHDPAFTWTVEPRAALTFRPPPGPHVLTLSVGGFVPRGYPPTRVTVNVDGVATAEWTTGAAVTDMRLSLPAAPPGGDIWIEFVVANPRMPAALLADSPDTRLLGIQLHALRLD